MLNNKYIIIIIIVISLILIMIILINSGYTNKNKSVKLNTVKVYKETATVNTLKTDITAKPKIYTSYYGIGKIEKDSVKQLTDTLYTAVVDTTIFYYDSSGKTTGVFNLTSEYLSDIKLSSNSLFKLKINAINISRNLQVYENYDNEIVSETDKGNRFGVGIFAGGLITHDKKLTYGIGVGIIYKLIY